MADVDALTRHFLPLLAKKLVIAAMITEIYQLQGPKSYVAATFIARKKSK